MKLSEHEHRRLLPLFMRKDGTAEGLAAGISEVVRKIDCERPILRKWDQIDSMTHEQLDEMAWELNVLWYDTAASLETKRRLIKNSDKVYARLGTKWAVEEVVASYLGDATVLEWWEYEGGRPHYFKVESENPQITTDLEELFLRALDIVKRKSQWLEAIVIRLSTLGGSYVGFTVNNAEISRHVIGSDKFRLYAAVTEHRASTDTVTITRQASGIESITLGIHGKHAIHDASIEGYTMKGGNP